MQRYFLQLSYKGANYHGWQIQPNAVSVQEAMEKNLSVLLRETINVVGAGRTDTGVNASFFMLHFDTAKPDIAGADNFVYKLNSLLPADIAVRRIMKVRSDAHARFSALSRMYEYYMTTEKNPFNTETAYRCKHKPDIKKMNEAAAILFEYTDFTSFSRLHSGVKTNNCRISRAEWTEQGSVIVFKIRADRFLRNMVRAIVGTLIEVGQGKLSNGEFRCIIEQRNRKFAGTSAPAHGLFLVDVEYPEDIFE